VFSIAIFGGIADRQQAVPKPMSFHHEHGSPLVALELPGHGSVQLTVGTNAAGKEPD